MTAGMRFILRIPYLPILETAGCAICPEKGEKENYQLTVGLGKISVGMALDQSAFQATIFL